MKRLKLIVLGFLPVAFVSCASTIDRQEIPSIVINAVMTKYPDARELEWEWKNGVYEAEFELGKQDVEVWVDEKGTILKVEQEIRNTEIPTVILSDIKTAYKDYKPDDAKRIEIGKAVYYEIELDGIFGDQTVVYSASGKKQDPAILTKIGN